MSAVFVSQISLPLLASSAKIVAAGLAPKMRSPKIAMFFCTPRPKAPEPSPTGSGRYSQSRSPVAASSAWTTAPGFGRYMTPSWISGAASCGPVSSIAHAQAS